MNTLTPNTRAVWCHNSTKLPRYPIVRIVLVHPHTARIEYRANGRLSQRWVKHHALIVR